MNNGLCGNRILQTSAATAASDGSTATCWRSSASARHRHAGTNDLRNRWAKPEEEVTAEQMIPGLQQMAVRAHSAGVKIIGATLTPSQRDLHAERVEPDPREAPGRGQ